MMQVPTIQPQALAPSYNAVKIDVHNPQVNTPPNINPITQTTQAVPSMYDMPKASIYEVPQQSIYNPNQNFSQPPTAEQTPSVPTPVIIPSTATQTPSGAPISAPTTPITNPIAPISPAAATSSVAIPQAVEIKTPEVVAPQMDINAFLAKLTSNNYDDQANSMEAIADLAQNSPQKATELLDTRVIDTLMGIMSKDTSKLQGPSPKQLEIREKIIGNKPVTEAESKEANVITPMEQAERNKQYAMYTTAILQKLFASEIQKTNNTVVPLTELPGAVGIVEQVKKNPNPMVRASAIDSLSYIQAPDYKQDLETIFSVAQKDKDKNVQQAATKALDKLKQMPTAAKAAPANAVANKVTEKAKA